MQRSQQMNLRRTELEVSDWAWAAGGKGKVSDWLRSLANAEVHRMRTTPQGASVPTANATDEELRIASSPEKIVVPESVGSAACPRERHHRKNTYCGSCGKVN